MKYIVLKIHDSFLPILFYYFSITKFLSVQSEVNLYANSTVLRNSLYQSYFLRYKNVYIFILSLDFMCMLIEILSIKMDPMTKYELYIN